MPEQKTFDVTDLPAKETPARTKVRKLATTVTVVTGALLLIEDQIRRFSRRKKVTVAVEDKPES